MAQLAPIATLAATGVSLYAADQQAKRQKKQAQAQYAVQQENAVATQQAQAEVLAAQASADTAARQRQLARTIATTRARLGAAGIAPDTGSAAAVADGLRRASAEAQSEDDATYAARLSRGRRSLLAPDASLQPSLIRAYATAGQGLVTGLRSLLD